MASEVQCSFAPGATLYFLIRGLSFNIGKVWNTVSVAFETYSTPSYTNYTTSMAQQGTASGFYTGTFPAAIGSGSYSIVVKKQIGGSPAESDPTVALGNFDWNSSYPIPLSDLSTSGQVGQTTPIRIFRGQQVANFPFKLVSSTDHVTPLLSGIISGQISRDGGAFGPLQSGAFTEIGRGWYNLQALTSGDLLANTVALSFTGVGISGGTSDPRDFALILQKTSGQ